MILKELVVFETSMPSNRKIILLLCWLLLSVILLAVDQLIGAVIQFPVFVLPVGLAVWYNGFRWGAALAVVVQLARFSLNFVSPTPMLLSISIINVVIRIISILAFALLMAYMARQHKELKREVKMLKGILPVCSFCKKIRDEQDAWQPIESYVTARSEALFSHGFCPDCYEQHYAKFVR